MDTLKIGIISDIHIGPRASYGGQVRKVTEAAEPLARSFVERMNTVFEPDLVINLGDVVQDLGFEEDVRGYRRIFEVLSGLEAPMYPLVGNHDLIEMGPDDLRAVWASLRHMGPLEDDRLYYTFEAGGWGFVALHSHESKDSHIWLDEGQIAWLEEALASLSGPVMVLVHHSLADQDTSGNHWFKRHPHLALIRERAAVRRLIEASGKVKAVINGHLHWNNLTAHAGIPYITVQSPIENALGLDPPRACGAWGELTLTGEGLSLEVFGEDPASWRWSFVGANADLAGPT